MHARVCPITTMIIFRRVFVKEKKKKRETMEKKKTSLTVSENAMETTHKTGIRRKK
jgi:hypothetical protein